ncbi:MAG: TetR/AcrR family transcriptional regulator [Acidiferrobacterales bacterium]
MAPNTDTREKILDHAESLLQEKGFNNFSYADISGPLKIKNAAVHYYFPSKAILGFAVIERYRDRLKGYSEHLNSKHGDDVLQLLDGFIAIPKSFLSKTKLGCPLGMLEADAGTLPDAMREATALLGKELWQWLTSILDRGKELGVFKYEGPARDKALLITAALQGASLMAATQSPKIFQITVKQVKRDLGIAL